MRCAHPSARATRAPTIFTTSPFHRFGVKIKTKGETKRDRRVTPDEEQRLLAAADKLNCAEHAFAGARMHDRIIGTLETGCRLGEMLKIQNRHVFWNTHQISIPAKHAKDAESPRAIQLLLGHADLKTTQRYLNVTDEELRKTMQQKLWNRK